MIDMLTLLEWTAFSLGALTVYCYGHNKKQGGYLGIITSLTFMLWGGLAGLYGAVTINIGFFLLHLRNTIRAYKDDSNIPTTQSS